MPSPILRFPGFPFAPFPLHSFSPSNYSWCYAPSPAFLAAALAPLPVMSHPFVSTIPAILHPPARPPPRICVSSCWFCAPLARRAPVLASVDVRTRSAREYGGCWEGGYASLAAASPPSLAFLPAPARAASSSSRCGSRTALSPRGLCCAVSLSPVRGSARWEEGSTPGLTR
ncbi:hypothetical protein DFH09DRAFT_1216063 [Mycena vulgaris]|nr:hypothetical protein DFH09DRAFT_1216063 [Mycena vulgaris]